MEKIKLTAYDAAEFLGTEKLQKGYLDYVAKEGTPEELIEAIKTVARAKGMSKTAKETGISRSGLYKALFRHSGAAAAAAGGRRCLRRRLQ